jgi:uncharacterized membrane protein
MQAGLTNAMPPGSANFMDPADRATIVKWYEAARAPGA